MRENQLQYDILLEFGARRHVRLWRNNSGLLFTITGERVRASVIGAPDIIGLTLPYGQFIGIECKGDRGKQTKEQFNFQRMIDSMGGLYILAYSVEDVRGRLERGAPR
jgi:hypothetical protein